MNSDPVVDPVVIVSAARTPMGAFQGELKGFAAPELGAAAIRAAVERAQIKPEEIEEVIMGCVLSAGQGQAPARQASIGAGLPLSTGCTTINKMCGSGMKSAMLAHDLLLFPLYALLDRSVGGLLHRRRRPATGSVNFVRVPVLLSGLLLLVFAPIIFQRSEVAYGVASGLDQNPYLARWLVISGVLFLASAVLYAVRGRRVAV